MHRLRHRRDLRALALLALAVQAVLSFGHMHVARAADAAAPIACRTFFPPADEHGCPPYRQDDKCCAVCWTITLSGSLILPAPPTLERPLPSAGKLAVAVSFASVPDTATAAFDARGPPSAALT